MNHNILAFLEAYKSLDELCKDLLKSDRGVSAYIDEMDRNSRGKMKAPGWENDYKQLKRMRWIRNRLVHDTNSFQDNLFTEEDIEWLKEFRCRIMERTDPFALLRQATTMRKTITVNQVKVSNQINTTNSGSKESPESMGKGLITAILILLGVASMAVILAIVTMVRYF